jgi:copper chaperone CopZ
MRRVVLNIRGLLSGDCAAHVYRSLCATSGVNGVEVDLPSRSACVEHDECTCNLNNLISAVTGVGLQVDGFELS